MSMRPTPTIDIVVVVIIVIFVDTFVAAAAASVCIFIFLIHNFLRFIKVDSIVSVFAVINSPQASPALPFFRHC